jgi:hypothetical protein
VSEQPVVRPDPAPVVEVVVAVSFNCLPASASVQFASFWRDRLADTFPRIEEQAPHFDERGAHPSPGSALPVDTHRYHGDGAPTAAGTHGAKQQPTHRMWFVNMAGDELLQLQRNWFAGNWRRTTSHARQVDWLTRRESFVGWLRALDAHLVDAGCDRLNLRQYELTYISHLHAGQAWKHHGEFDKAFHSAGLDELPPYLRRESVRLEQEFLILGRTGPAEGRLRVKATPGYAAGSRAPVYVLESSVRGAPGRLSMSGLAASLDLARQAILDAIAALTVDTTAQPGGVDAPETEVRATDHVVRPPSDLTAG